MANRETYPASLFPLRGDISAEAGVTSVTVTGIRGITVTPIAPVQGQILYYNATDNMIEWTSAVSGILINGVPSSSNKQVFLNGISDGSNPWTILINGVSDGG